MEAANLGAYFALQPETALSDAIDTLFLAPAYPGNQKAYVAAATRVRHQYKDSGLSLAIPTWAYSDEPTGQFSSRIGKYFSNSIREDGLLAIAAWGVVFAPGSAGTLQEVFRIVRTIVTGPSILVAQWFSSIDRSSTSHPRSTMY
jgi:hypothetical protein